MSLTSIFNSTTTNGGFSNVFDIGGFGFIFNGPNNEPFSVVVPGNSNLTALADAANGGLLNLPGFIIPGIRILNEEIVSATGIGGIALLGSNPIGGSALGANAIGGPAFGLLSNSTLGGNANGTQSNTGLLGGNLVRGGDAFDFLSSSSSGGNANLSPSAVSNVVLSPLSTIGNTLSTLLGLESMNSIPGSVAVVSGNSLAFLTGSTSGGQSSGQASNSTNVYSGGGNAFGGLNRSVSGGNSTLSANNGDGIAQGGVVGSILSTASKGGSAVVNAIGESMTAALGGSSGSLFSLNGQNNGGSASLDCVGENCTGASQGGVAASSVSSTNNNAGTAKSSGDGTFTIGGFAGSLLGASNTKAGSASTSTSGKPNNTTNTNVVNQLTNSLRGTSNSGSALSLLNLGSDSPMNGTLANIASPSNVLSNVVGGGIFNSISQTASRLTNSIRV